MPVSLYYWNDMPNFGDRLNEDVCRFLSGSDPVWASPKRCNAAFIGSILEKFIYRRRHWTVDALWIKYFRPKVDVWGSGFIKSPETSDERLMRRLDVHAVRGRITLERLRRLTGQTLDDVAVGDPGLFASRLHPIRRGIIKAFLFQVYKNTLSAIWGVESVCGGERSSKV